VSGIRDLLGLSLGWRSRERAEQERIRAAREASDDAWAAEGRRLGRSAVAPAS